jgi:NTE family protein
MTIRTLVLSGGGGRGGFHAGVYKYLMEANKANVDAAHQGAWMPQVIVGTSIGAVNGAAIAQGMSATELERFWLSLRENDIQGLPPSMGWLARRVANLILRPTIGTPLKRVPPEISLSPEADESWPPLPLLPRALSERLIGRWSNLLDTGPLHQTMLTRMKFDESKINTSAVTLLISATNVRTGEAVVFSNRPVDDPKRRNRYKHSRITSKRVIASCSIPMVYPWTKDDDGEIYWDGAVVQNTPLGPAFDAVSKLPIEEPMEAVIVMMTPWWEAEPTRYYDGGRLPQDFGEAMTWTLDWALLSSFRRDLKQAETFNKLAQDDAAHGIPPRYRMVKPIIVAPDQFLPATRIIDYDEAASRALIDAGYQAAKQAFESQFGV